MVPARLDASTVSDATKVLTPPSVVEESSTSSCARQRILVEAKYGCSLAISPVTSLVRTRLRGVEDTLTTSPHVRAAG